MSTLRTHIAAGLLLALLTSAVTLPAIAGEKQEARVTYVIKNLKLKGEASAKLKPLLEQFLGELSTAKAPHKALKDKLQDAIDGNKLTAAQCDQLFESKQKQEAQEQAIRKKYYALFKTVVTTQQAYKAIKLSDDKLK